MKSYPTQKIELHNLEDGNDSWEAIKEFYEQELNIPREVVEALAVYDILHLVVMGFSNKDISIILDTTISEIETTASRYLDFSGFDKTAQCCPLLVYKAGQTELGIFYQIMKEYVDEDLLKTLYLACAFVIEIGEKINEYYS